MPKPSEYFNKLCLPQTPHENTHEQTRENATSFFCFCGILAGLYSCIKWYKNDVPDLYLGSLVLILGPMTTMLLIKLRICRPLVSANLAVASMAFYTGVLIYQLGGINSAHILWTIGIIIFAYLLTDSKSGMFWSSLVFLYCLLLIAGQRSGHSFPVHELDAKQDMINSYSGYLLPVILLWLAQSYSMKVRNTSLHDTQVALAEATILTQQSEVMSENLGEVITQAGNSSEALLSASDKLSQTVTKMTSQSEGICNGVERQDIAATEINQTLIKMAESVQQSTEVMAEITQKTNDSQHSVSRSADSMNQAIEFMEQIKESNNGILGIMRVISDIAEQTNLLALNASIEAARAGDQGRGFAVVADEVRSLSQKSNTSAAQIKLLLDQATSDVSEGALIVNRAGEILTGVVSSVQEISTQMSDVNSVMIQQNKDIEGVVVFSNEVSDLSHKNTESGMQLLNGSAELSDMAEKLSSLAHSMHDIVKR
jgi:hypothetical protein